MLASGMIKVVVLVSAMTGLLFTGAVLAQTATYTWAGKGVSPAGSSRCPNYYMVINVTVQGNSVKGRFQQEIRQERHFEATKDASGAFNAAEFFVARP
jgi:hypothetical protein